MNRDPQEKRITSILKENEDLDFDEAVKVFYEYLMSNLSLPCEVMRTGRTDVMPTVRHLWVLTWRPYDDSKSAFLS